MNILIVDDEWMELETIRRLINREQLKIDNIYTAMDIHEAKELLCACGDGGISIVLCDIEMPHGSGLELTRWIRAEGYKAEIVFITGHAKFDYAAAALRLGVMEYLLKPVEEEQLMEAILKAASKRKALEARTSNHSEPEASGRNTGRQPEQREMEPDAEKIIEYARQYIADHYAEDISRTEIAGKLYIHPDYFSHIFKEYTGLTFKEYLIRIRITVARKLLRETRKTVSEIAICTGYSNPAHFGKYFKKETGVSPLQYRASFHKE